MGDMEQMLEQIARWLVESGDYRVTSVYSRNYDWFRSRSSTLVRLLRCYMLGRVPRAL
jgi:hypothetical protein